MSVSLLHYYKYLALIIDVFSFSLRVESHLLKVKVGLRMGMKEESIDFYMVVGVSWEPTAATSCRLNKNDYFPTHLFDSVWVLLSPTLADVHLCGVDAAWLWEEEEDRVSE